MAGVMQTRNRGDNNSDKLSDPNQELISLENRASKGSLTMAWWGVCSAMFYLVIGIAMAENYGTKNAIIGLLVSCVSFGIINGIISRYAIRTGMSVALFSRVLFGHKGAALATLIFFATAMYYAVFEGSVIAVTFHQTYPSLPYWLAALIVVAYSVPMIMGSVQSWLDKLNGILLPFYLIGLIGAVVMATSEYGYSNVWLTLGPEKALPYGWWNVAVYYMGVWVLMMYTFDYARYGKTEDSKYLSWFSFGITFYLVAFFLSGLAGIYLVSTIPLEGELSEVSITLGLVKLMGVFGLIFVVITQTRINTANYLLATTNLQAFIKDTINLKVPKFVGALLIGIFIFILMLLDVFNYLLQALAYQGVFVVAWVAIALTHILYPKREEVFGAVPIIDPQYLPAFDKSGLVAWIVASIVGIVLMNMGGSWVNWYATLTFITATVLYAILMPKNQQSVSQFEPQKSTV
ncbi:purine-cytosine permease family protein [Psychrobacter sp. SCQQ22]|uniref:purine-cytosine permease family protein n=1 Tax=Psychrobacter sp. SCQQ22 TaxID=2792059 RepID=UPI001D10E0AC|nr:allantoin permease [Psychrobacter sp. SCQQ22]